MFDLTYISLAPYFILMICFVGLASFLDFESPLSEGTTPHGDRFNVPLESLRGILALGVFFHHAVTTFYYFKTGKWGPAPSPFYLLLGSGPVIMFFFLSGYLFWRKCLTQSGIKDWRGFFLARARRLLPAYFFVLAFIVLIAFVVTGFTVRESPILVLKEIVQWATIGVPLGIFPDINGYLGTHMINAGVAWSLRYEVLFYFSLPLLGLFSRKHWTLVWFIFFSALYGLMFRLTHASSFSGGEWAEFVNNLSMFFGLGFSLGMLTAYLKTGLPETWELFFRRKFWAVLALALVFIQFYKNYPAYSVRQSIYLIFPFMIVAFGNDLFTLLRRRPLLFLGKISYSIYLVHGVVIFVLSRALSFWMPFESLNPIGFWAFTLFSGSVAIVLSTAIYRWVELPWLSRSSCRKSVLF
jgi:peptidoglycan/LPS O-acetylase OafA/YrhL